MDSFCTKCGAPLPAGAEFCPSCGTPLVAQAATSQSPPPPAYSAPVAPGAIYPSTAPLPVKKKKSLAMKIVLSLVAVVVGGFLLLVLIGYFVQRKQNAGSATPGGQAAPATTGTAPTTPSAPTTATVPSVPNAPTPNIGVTLYPGATLDPSASQTVVNGTTTVVQATYWTSDPVTSVTSFYQASAVDVMALGTETILNFGSGNNRVTMMVDADSGKTKMNVIHTITGK
jgi:cytoskeletal protein RodZ